jgi:hypothetical protein
MVSACAAVFRQEILGVSVAPISSATLAAEAVIGTVLFWFSSSGPAFPCGRKRMVNDSKLAPRHF